MSTVLDITAKIAQGNFDERQDFSLVLGGPLYQLFIRCRLSGDALDHVRRRVGVITLIAWLPLVLLAALAGTAVHGRVAVPFLFDVEAQLRFLVALPLLIFAELVVHQRMRFVVRQFLERRLIPDAALARFHSAIESAFRLRNSVFVEVLLIAFVYVVGVLLFWRHYVALSAATWYGTPTPEGLQLSTTGVWYAYVSLPLYQFLLVRWYFRIFIWMRFLTQVSRIELSLIPTHPDRVGGLGFLGNTVYAFVPLLLAHGVIVSGPIANRIFYLGSTLPQFMIEIAVVVGFLLCIVFGPLLVFAPQLAQTKRTAGREYGALAGRYVRVFDAKWLRGGASAGEPFIGSADIQSLADLANSFEVVRSMRLAPISLDAVLQLLVVTLLPVAPLVLTMMSVEEVLKRLVGILL